jgi:hypothetical protein
MSKRTILVLAVAFLLLASGVVLAGGVVRDKFLEMHGHGDQPAAAGAAKDTPLVDLARRWSVAFNAGEDAMRAFFTNNVAADALKQRSVEERMKGYKTLRARFRTLTPKKVLNTSPGTAELLMSAADGSEHEFIFSGDTKAPFKLRTIGRREMRHHGK